MAKEWIHNRLNFHRSPWRMALAYFVIGVLWIVGSDYAVEVLVNDSQLARRAQTIKGWGFIVITAMLFYYVVAQLISERRRAVNLLERTRQDFLRLVEASSEGVWILDAAGQTVFVNSRFAEMLGVKKDELLRRDPSEFLAEPWREASRRALADRAKISHDSYELRFTCTDGRELVLLVNGTAIYDAHETFSGCMRLLSDVTNLRRTGSQLMTAYENQRALLNELNHRVRNNLASLLSLIELSRSRASDTDEFAEMLRGRVHALSQAYSVTTQERRSPVLLEELVRAIATAAEGQRLQCGGPEVAIEVDRISALAIVLNELVALSRRFGALGERDGQVELTWQWIDSAYGPRLQLQWTESGADARPDEVARNPSANLIESLSRADLRGSARVESSEGGLVVHLELDVGEQVVPESGDFDGDDEVDSDRYSSSER